MRIPFPLGLGQILSVTPGNRGKIPFAFARAGFFEQRGLTPPASHLCTSFLWREIVTRIPDQPIRGTGYPLKRPIFGSFPTKGVTYRMNAGVTSLPACEMNESGMQRVSFATFSSGTHP